jgi:hypothetical protein
VKRSSVGLVVVASTILVATAAFHATGYSSVARQVASSSLSPFFKRALPPIWLFFSWHLVAIALAVSAASFSRLAAVARPILLAAAVVVAVDFLWVLSIAGLFAGTILLLTASACLFAAGWLHAPGDSRSP